MKTENPRRIVSQEFLGYENAARQLVVKTGEYAATRFGRAKRVSGVGNSVVTDADEANTSLILPFLNSKYLLHQIKTEETSIPGELFEHAADPALTWWVDELDGSNNFLNAIPLWGTAAALRRNGTTLAGAIYLPRMWSEYYASHGNGAYLLRNDKTEPTKLHVSDPGDELTLGVDVQSGRNLQLLGRLVSEIKNAGLANRVNHRVTGTSAFDYSMVANGGYDAHLNRILKGWDIYPGDVLVREAQGASSQIDNDAVLMSNGHRHDKLLEVVGNVLVEFP